MKKQIINIAILAMMTVATSGCGVQSGTTSTDSSTGTSTLGNILSQLGQTVSSLTSSDSFELSSLNGTWNYSAPSVAFKSDDALKKIGGATVATQIENKISPYYEKAGLNNIVLTFDKESNFVLKYKSISLSGTVTREDGMVVFNFKSQNLGINLGKISAICTLGSNQLSVCFDAEKFVSILNTASSLTGNSTVSTISSLINSYDGIYVGFKLTKS